MAEFLMTRRTFKRGITRLWIVLAVGFDLWCLVQFIQNSAFSAFAFFMVAIINVAWFVALKACFWVFDGFTKENV
jgi:hypothetical protein